MSVLASRSIWSNRPPPDSGEPSCRCRPIDPVLGGGFERPEVLGVQPEPPDHADGAAGQRSVADPDVGVLVRRRAGNDDAVEVAERVPGDPLVGRPSVAVVGPTQPVSRECPDQPRQHRLEDCRVASVHGDQQVAAESAGRQRGVTGKRGAVVPLSPGPDGWWRPARRHRARRSRSGRPARPGSTPDRGRPHR